MDIFKAVIIVNIFLGIVLLPPSFLKDFIYLFLDRGEGREEERVRTSSVVASHTLPPGDLACNPGMCPDWELNQQPFGLQASTQSTEPHQPGI